MQWSDVCVVLGSIQLSEFGELIFGESEKLTFEPVFEPVACEILPRDPVY